VHVVASIVNLGLNAVLPDAVIAFRAAKIMNGMLMRGAHHGARPRRATHGLRMARDEAFRRPAPEHLRQGVVPDGRALRLPRPHDTRDTALLRSPARHVGPAGRWRAMCAAPAGRRSRPAPTTSRSWPMAASHPHRSIAFVGFSKEEVLASVEEAENAGTYVAAHLYTDSAILRAVECGVRSLEHCNLIQSGTARFAAERGAIACPTLVTYQALKDEGASLGLPAETIAKIDDVRTAGLRSLEIMRDAGLMMAFGTDLLGDMHRHQSSNSSSVARCCGHRGDPQRHQRGGLRGRQH
jgi:hypothetical protein